MIYLKFAALRCRVDIGEMVHSSIRGFSVVKVGFGNDCDMAEMMVGGFDFEW